MHIMFNFKTVLRHALFAVALASTALAAHAGPRYHVTVDATSFSAADAGYLDIGLFGVGGSAAAIATVTNLQGNIVGLDTFSSGIAEPTPGVFVLSNQLGSYLSHDVTLGGMFSFDVDFSGDFLTTPDAFGYVSPFDVTLYDVGLATLAELSFELTQLSGAGPATVGLLPGATLANATLVTAAAVPEPSELLLMLTGLGLVGFMVRRKAAAA
jgi:hypothetical protein